MRKMRSSVLRKPSGNRAGFLDELIALSDDDPA